MSAAIVNAPVIANFGGGTNSTAMLIEMVRRGEPIHAVLFADTGGEKPHTYLHLDVMDDWLQARGYPGITRVKRVRKGKSESIEEVCLRTNTMPSIAYGFKISRWLGAEGVRTPAHELAWVWANRAGLPWPPAPDNNQPATPGEEADRG